MPTRVWNKSSSERTRKPGEFCTFSRSGHPESRRQRQSGGPRDLTNAHARTQITSVVARRSVCPRGVPRSARDDTRSILLLFLSCSCSNAVPTSMSRSTSKRAIKATGASEKALSRGARLWVYLWRNLTHR
jgi:hypothetical protein